jgi:hypothetical protein
MVAVTYCSLEGLKGAAVANLFEEKYKIGKPISVSPKLLTPEEKRRRWISLWLKVEIKKGICTDDTTVDVAAGIVR